MRKRITVGALRDYSFQLRNEGMDACLEAHAIDSSISPRKYSATKERAETLRRVANEIDAMLDGEAK